MVHALSTALVPERRQPRGAGLALHLVALAAIGGLIVLALHGDDGDGIPAGMARAADRGAIPRPDRSVDLPSRRPPARVRLRTGTHRWSRGVTLLECTQGIVEMGSQAHGRGKHGPASWGHNEKEVDMDPDHGRARAPTDAGQQVDDSFPSLLLVTLASVLVAVGGVVAISLVPTTSMLLVSMLLVLLGVVAVTAMIGLQLDDEDGRTPRHDAPAPELVITVRERSTKRRDDDDARRAA